jgi:hypothetical protein
MSTIMLPVGGHGLLDDVRRLAGAGELRSFLHGALLDARDARGHGDDHARLRPAALVHLLDEVAQHLLADLEVRDDAVLQRADGADVARRAADHPLRLDAHRERATVVHVDGDDRRLVEDDALTPHVDERVRGAEIHGHVPADDAAERAEEVAHAVEPLSPGGRNDRTTARRPGVSVDRPAQAPAKVQAVRATQARSEVREPDGDLARRGFG